MFVVVGSVGAHDGRGAVAAAGGGGGWGGGSGLLSYTLGTKLSQKLANFDKTSHWGGPGHPQRSKSFINKAKVKFFFFTVKRLKGFL